MMIKGAPRPSIRLKLGEVPKYPFVNVPFDVAIHLVDETGQLKCGDEIPLNIKLCFDEKPLRDCEEGLLVLDNPAPKISKTGTATIRVRVSALSMRYENKKFIIYASIDNTSGGPYVSPAVSEPMLCIRYRLKILEDSIPDIWYKDEGGRDKCIDLTVQLQDQNQELIVSRKVPLRVTLLYESGHHVLKQDILKINPENKLMIDESGKALLRLRIEDVSKNHQKQLFSVQIVPDTVQHPLNNDISPDSCRPLEVRSKRNKRTREPSLSSSALDRYPVTSQRTEVKVSASTSALNRLPVPKTYPPPPSLPMAKAATSSSAASMYPLIGSSAVNPAPPGLTPTANNTLPPNYNSASGSAITTSDSCMSVLGWVQFVLQKLAEIQWRQIGTETGTGRPLYEMTNPNMVIEEIYQRYDNEAGPMAGRLYQDICGPSNQLSSADLKYLEEESMTLSGNGNGKNGTPSQSSSFSSSTPLQSIPHMRDRSDSESHRAGNALLGLSGASMSLLPPPVRERDQSLFNLPDDLPSFQRASTTEIFETLNVNGLGPSALNDLGGQNGTYYIVAKKFYSKNVNIPLGLAAFNDNKKLIGWYIGHSDKFIGLAEFPSRLLSAEDVKKATEIGEMWIDSGDPSCIFVLDNFESEEKMVEEAIIWWWTHHDTAESINLWE